MSFDDDVNRVAGEFQRRVHESIERTANSPLLDTDPDAITRAFEADPLTLTDNQLDALVSELRRRRNAFAASEAAKGLKKKDKEKAPPPPSVVTQAKLDKPAKELSIDDLFDED